jgi:hypothetical protein
MASRSQVCSTSREHWRLQVLRVTAAACLLQLICSAKIVFNRDPLDGALDASVIVIMRQQTQDSYQIDEVFLGNVNDGDVLVLPDFKMEVEDRSSVIAGQTRFEPILPGTRILVFLKPATPTTRPRERLGDWQIAGLGNCFFWSHDPENLDSLRAMANSAIALRSAWEAARNLPDKEQRVVALWPYRWDKRRVVREKTQAALQEIGPVAGDHIAAQWPTMSRDQKKALLYNLGEFGGERLHETLLLELKMQLAAWEEVNRRGGPAAEYVDGVLYLGLAGLGSFHDRSDLPFIRETAVWAVRHRLKSVGESALNAFQEMPDKANLPVIEAIWNEHASKAMDGYELDPTDVVRCLETHRFPETIPLMAQFVNLDFEGQIAQDFLVSVTCVDFGADKRGWLTWYESHKNALVVGR